MITFLVALALLILGYVVYGAFVEKVFGADPDRKTPCYTHQDGVDYVPMPTWKIFLIHIHKCKARLSVSLVQWDRL